MSLHLFTGKGGVGKTRLALLKDQYERRQNPDGVLCGEGSPLRRMAIEMNLASPQILESTPAELTASLLERVIKIPIVTDWLSKRRLLQNILRLAPNLEELLIFHHWIQAAKTHAYCVVDGPSTGSFLAVLHSIPTALRMFDGGAIRELAEECDLFLKEPAQVEILVCSLPENSAIEEMNEIVDGVKSLYPKISIQKVLNRRHAPLAPTDLKTVPPALVEFYEERRRREEQRISAQAFNAQFFEGALEWTK
jgi:hypothetical protein